MKLMNVLDVENNIDFTFQSTKADGGLINGVQGFEYPSTKVVVEDIASKGGAKEVTSRFGRRICSFVYRITCDVLENRRAILAAMRQTGYLKLVTFTTLDDIALQFYAYVNKILAPYTSMTTPILIEFSAPDWRFFSQTLYSASIANAGTGTAINAGNEITDPVFRLYGPFDTATVQNLSSGDELSILDTVADTHYVEINTTDHTVLLDGVTSMYSAWDTTGDFFSLIPGENALSFDTTAGGGATHLELEWRDAYNGL